MFLATQLARLDRDVLLLEASPRPGGVAATVIEDGFVLEPAAGTFMLPHRSLTPLLDSAGVAVEEAYPDAALRYVWMRDSLVAIHYGPKALATSALSKRGKLRMAAEPFIRSSPPDEGVEESLREFLTRRLGREAGTLLSHIAASGVYAGDPNNMSAAAAFPLFTELEAEAGSIVRGGIRRVRALPKPRPPKPKSHIPVGGMSEAAATLAASLGERYRSEHPVTSITKEGDYFRIEGAETLHARSVVIALRPDAASTILQDIDTTVLHGWPSSRVVVVGVGGAAQDVPLPSGFGFLTGPDTDAVTLGCLFESSYAPGRAAPGRSLAKSSLAVLGIRASSIALMSRSSRPSCPRWNGHSEPLSHRHGRKSSEMLPASLSTTFITGAGSRLSTTLRPRIRDSSSPDGPIAGSV